MGHIVKPYENKPHTVDLEGFDGYEITQDGKVFKKSAQDGKYRKERYEVTPFIHPKSKSLRVLLWLDKKKRTRGVVALVLDSFYPAPKSRASREVYFLNKDEQNAAIENLKVIDF